LRKTIVLAGARLSLSKKSQPRLFVPIVKWITVVREIPGQAVVHRAAQADFNVRAGKAVWRYTAPTALFFVPDLPETPDASATDISRILAGW
jgi:hypothetical protein